MKYMFEIIRKLFEDLGVELYLVVAAVIGSWLKVKKSAGTWFQKATEIGTASLISVLTTPALAELFDVKSTKVITLIAVITSYAGLALVDAIKDKLFKKVEEL